MAQSSALNRRGQPCRATMIIPGTDPPVFRIHSLSVEEHKAQSARGGRAKGERARKELPVEFDTVCWILELVIATLNDTYTPRRPPSISPR